MNIEKSICDLRVELIKAELHYTNFLIKDKDDFPFEYICHTSAEEDNADTDHYRCVMSDDNVSIVFSVETKNKNKALIKYIDTTCVDVIINGTIFDCIDFENYDNFINSLGKIMEKVNNKNEFEVSASINICPYIKVTATNEEEAKKIAKEIFNDRVSSLFPKCDFHYLTNARGEEDFEVEKIFDYNAQAKVLLKLNNVSDEHFNLATCTEKRTIGDKHIEYIYLDFQDKGLNYGNLCYLLIDNKPIFLKHPDKGYPADIREALTYSWTDGISTFFLDDEFNGILLDKDGIGYKRACHINQLFDYKGVIILQLNDLFITARPFDENDDDISYEFEYSNNTDIEPCFAKKVEILHNLA